MSFTHCTIERQLFSIHTKRLQSETFRNICSANGIVFFFPLVRLEIKIIRSIQIHCYYLLRKGCWKLKRIEIAKEFLCLFQFASISHDCTHHPSNCDLAHARQAENLQNVKSFCTQVRKYEEKLRKWKSKKK